MYKIAVFVSGRGSNLKSILDYIKLTKSNIQIAMVISDKLDCPAFEIANANSIKTYSVSLNTQGEFIPYEQLLNSLKINGINLLVLAGFLKKIPNILIDEFENRIINIHPALLPSFGGKGMYGKNVHRAVFEKSAQISGATIHFVDKVYDNGKIIAQQSVDISDVNDFDEIAKRVLKIEHKLLPKIIEKFSQGKVVEKNNRIYILD